MEGWAAADLAAMVERRAQSTAPLDRLDSAVSVVDELRSVGDEVLDRFVAEARAAGCSWSQVGAVLGVSKQAAQQRFPAAGPLSSWPDGVTETVRAAMVVAEEESRNLGHNYVGNEHLLLGLLAQTDGMAADVLAALGVTRAAILARTREVVGGADSPRRWEALGVTPRLERALELARAEARRLGHRSVATKHVLLGIARLDEGVAAKLLRELGAPPARVRAEIATRLGIDPSQLTPLPRRRTRLLRRS
jgi:Clp amino terminal domain, pathogenicity island component